MILLDTTVLSLAYRRRRRGHEEPTPVQLLRQMILEDAPLFVPGMVFQELLSGVRAEEQFHRLYDLMEGFPILLAEKDDHVAAARVANACRRGGVATTAVDCLIAGMAISRDAQLFTVDGDFSEMASHCPVRIFPAEL